MNYSHCFLWGALFISAPSWSASGKITKETIEFMGQKRSFHLFVPKALPSGTAVPLLVTLHGSGGDGASLVDKWKDLAAEEKVILAGPDSRDPGQCQEFCVNGFRLVDGFRLHWLHLSGG